MGFLCSEWEYAAKALKDIALKSVAVPASVYENKGPLQTATKQNIWLVYFERPR
jgi:hypothetical protein